MENQEDINKKSFWGGLVTGLLLSLCLVCGIYLAVQVGRQIQTKKQLQTQQSQGQMEAQDEESGESASVVNDETLAKMEKIEQVIDTYFYHEDIDKELMAEEIYRGMVNTLEDPYSTYYTEEELTELMESTEGIYYGIGAYISADEKTGYAMISGIIEGTPAEESELREGDILYTIEGESTYGKELSEVVAMIKGQEGSKVHIQIVRDGEDDYLEKDVERRRIVSPTVNYEMYDNGIGYIQITEFDDVTADQFAVGMAVLKESGMTKMILDLRSNPGGNLNTVVEIARMLLPEGMIVYTEDRDGNRTEYTCDGNRELEIPLVVLVNGYSASASEILAGAIKDYGIGTLVGTTTYGKGIVQQVVSLKDGSAVKLTVSSYFTPKGNNIHGIGIEPDEVCEFNADAYYNEENKYDNQLERAKEILSATQTDSLK